MNKKQKRRLAAIQRQQALVDAAKNGKRQLTAEEEAEMQTLQREIEQLTTEIAAEEEQQRSLGGGGTPPANPTPPVTPPAPTGGQDEGQRQLEAERTRTLNITTMCRDFGIEDADLQRYIKDGTSEDQVRAAILEKLRQDKPPLGTGIHVTESGEDEFRRDASEGLLLRGGVELEKPSEGAAHFSHMTLRDLAIECLERAGVSDARRMSNDGLLQELFSRQYFNPTAAFPSILDNAIEKAYVQGHRTAAVTFDQWTRKGSLKDFKTHDNNYLAGPIGDFLEVPEGGELKNDKPTDAKLPTRKLKTYGKQFTLSRQAFINDDIDLVTRIPARYAAAARRTINTQCYTILMNNPPIYDGKQLFTAAHKNILTTGTGITQAAVQAMILALSTQKDEFDQPIIVRPGKIIVPAGLDFDIYTLFNSPTIRRMETPGQLGFVWDIYHDWGINVMDYRGCIKNPGIKINSPLG